MLNGQIMNLLYNFASAFSLGCLEEDDIAFARGDTDFLFCFCFRIGELCERRFFGQNSKGSVNDNFTQLVGTSRGW